MTMNKGTHFLGQPMYSQLISLLDKAQILRISQENGGERYVKHFDAWQHLVVMLYAVVNASTPFVKSWHLCCPKPANWDIWALTPCRAASHFRMPTCAVTNVSSKPSTESCTPLISTCFPRTADGAVSKVARRFANHRFDDHFALLQSYFQRRRVASEDREKEGQHQSSRQYSCQRVCALRHPLHLGAQGGFLHAPPLQLPQRRYLDLCQSLYLLCQV